MSSEDMCVWTFRDGDPVMLTQLARMPHLNGRAGRVSHTHEQQPTDPERCTVVLDSGDIVFVKTDNLVLRCRTCGSPGQVCASEFARDHLSRFNQKLADDPTLDLPCLDKELYIQGVEQLVVTLFVWLAVDQSATGFSNDTVERFFGEYVIRGLKEVGVLLEAELVGVRRDGVHVLAQDRAFVLDPRRFCTMRHIFDVYDHWVWNHFGHHAGFLGLKSVWELVRVPRFKQMRLGSLPLPGMCDCVVHKV